MNIQDVEEFLVVGNSVINESLKQGEEIDNHPFVVRFGEGAMPDKLESLKEFIGTKTDLYCLNGWIMHPTEHLKDKKVLFTRPPNDEYPLNYGLCVKDEQKNNILKATSDIDFISKQVFFDFFKEYGYENPTSGLIFIYYVKKVLNKQVKLINFNFNKDLTSFCHTATIICGHNPEIEKNILDKII